MPEDMYPQIPQDEFGQPQQTDTTGLGYGELNPPQPTSQAEGVIVEDPQ